MCVCRSDSQVGVLRVWNVSRSTPLDSFKLKKTGFHTLHVLNSPLIKKGKTKRAISAVSMLASRRFQGVSGIFSPFAPQLRAPVLPVKVSIPVPPVKLCLLPPCPRTAPSLFLLATLCAASWMEEWDFTTWEPKSGTSCETW